MFSSLLVDLFMPLMSSVESALKSSSFSLYFSSGCPVMKNPRISFSRPGACAHPNPEYREEHCCRTGAGSSANTPKSPCWPDSRPLGLLGAVDGFVERLHELCTAAERIHGSHS